LPFLFTKYYSSASQILLATGQKRSKNLGGPMMIPDQTSSSTNGSSWPGGRGGANGKFFPRGPKNTLAGHRGPYFLLAGQMYLFSLNCESLAGHFFSPEGHSWPAGSYLRSAVLQSYRTSRFLWHFIFVYSVHTRNLGKLNARGYLVFYSIAGFTDSWYL